MKDPLILAGEVARLAVRIPLAGPEQGTLTRVRRSLPVRWLLR
jgi:hypothetical protein